MQKNYIILTRLFIIIIESLNKWIKTDNLLKIFLRL